MANHAPMNPDQPSFQALFRSLDFERPLDVSVPADKELYVENLHASEGYSPLEDLQASIEMSDRPGTWLFTGHRGVGKSTELRRMAANLRQNGYVVLVVDMMDYLNMAEPLHIEGLLLNMAAALADEAEQMLPSMHGMSGGPVARLWSFLKNTDISVPELSPELSVGDESVAQAKISFKAEFKRRPDLRQKVLDAVKNAPGKLAEQVRGFAKEVVQGAQASVGSGTRVVLILD